MLEFQNIYKSFKNDFWSKQFFALEDVSFMVRRGELVGFLGANGAGKTTSIKIILGFIKQNKGRISFAESLGRNKQDILSRVGYFPERPFFYPYLTGREMIFYTGKLSDVKNSDISDRMTYWAKRLQIDHALERKIRDYSKGMLQRLGLISALIHDPDFLILDEPLAGLDPLGRKEFKDILTELNREGKNIFFSSHIVSDVEEICKKVIVLENGKLLYEGSIDSLIKDHIKPGYYFKISSDININTQNYIRIVDEREDSKLYEVDALGKMQFINEIMEKGGELIEVSQNKPTLEEIIYKIQK